jgi:hypothetical protein
MISTGAGETEGEEEEEEEAKEEEDVDEDKGGRGLRSSSLVGRGGASGVQGDSESDISLCYE